LSVLVLETAEVFAPLLEPARYKGAHGGRGSGKSHFFAELLVEDAQRFPGDAGEGLRGLCVREIQKSLKQSAKKLIEDKLAANGLGTADGFKIYESVIKTPGDGILEFHGMQDHTAESVKSFEGFHRAWAEEGQTMSSTSLSLLRPTIRWENKRLGLFSEIWSGWNPRRKTDPIDLMLRGPELPTGAIVVQANWRDNPWFPSVLEQERLDCLRQKPDQYDHIWEGGYVTVADGAYYAKHLAEAKAQGRIGRVAPDPLMTIRAYWDIGGTGAKADATAIWICQFVGREIRVLDYYEAQGQPLAAHLNWLREKKYGKALCVLPHDGANNEKIINVSYESAIREAGFEVTVIPNQGRGAAAMRVEAGRRLFPSIWFNETTTEAGRDALGWYHERKDETRNIGLGPEHDWSSHGADAFGLMCVAYEEPREKRKAAGRPSGAGSWMG
jgi:phage terminase large subunit